MEYFEDKNLSLTKKLGKKKRFARVSIILPEGQMGFPPILSSAEKIFSSVWVGVGLWPLKIKKHHCRHHRKKPFFD